MATAEANAKLATSKYSQHGLATSIMLPMAVKAVVELGIPDLLSEGGKPLSAQEILAKLPTKTSPGPNSFRNLERLMRPLAQEGVFSLTLNEESHPAYGLTEISQSCVTHTEKSLVPCYKIMFSPEYLRGFSRLHEVILDEDNTPFAAEWGIPFYEYGTTHPEFGQLFDKAMTRLTRFDLEDVSDKLQRSGWLDGVKTLVDVGGGQGSVVGRIVAQNPQIGGINFDHPQVIEGAPDVNGVRNVGGDFFKAVPSGDAMFLKFIMHNYGDEESIKILTRCFEALPQGGKVIIAENILIESDNGLKATLNAAMDLAMLGLLKGGRERTEAEYQAILSAAGFSKVSALNFSVGMDLIQGVKD